MTTIEKMIYQLNQKGISPTKMMKDLGFSSGLFSQWKKGLQNPSIEKTKAIADYLNVPVDYLISSGYTESIKKSPAGAEEKYLNNLRKELNDLTEEEIDEFITIAKYIKSKRQKNNSLTLNQTVIKGREHIWKKTSS